jgi:ubiquinone/menaquinone biosynthesis C-methylase UbiE
MNMLDSEQKEHWEAVYATKAATALSWFQADPRLSFALIAKVAPAKGGRVIDVGGGASVLVDRLLELPLDQITVLDLSEHALAKGRSRLGARSSRVRWLAADVTEIPDVGTYDVWHDRALFHFLTDAGDREKYLNLAHRSIPVGGHLVIATFAQDGPRRCSNLDVCRYDADSLCAEFADGFTVVSHTEETHTTPSGSPQPFLYGVFRRHDA